jgi:hypothetical protein
LKHSTVGMTNLQNNLFYDFSQKFLKFRPEV